MNSGLFFAEPTMGNAIVKVQQQYIFNGAVQLRGCSSRRKDGNSHSLDFGHEGLRFVYRQIFQGLNGHVSDFRNGGDYVSRTFGCDRRPQTR